MFTHEELLKETSSLEKFAMKLTRNRDDADDLLQTTIVTALSKKDRFEQGTNLFSWMSRIMFNSFVSRYRHNTRFETQFDPQTYIEQQTVEASQENETDVGLVGQAMMALSDDHQEILRLVCIDGMQYAEVAEMLNIPVGTVRSRLSRAREGLQEQLKVGRPQRSVAARLSPAATTPALPAADELPDIGIRSEAVISTKPELMKLVAANQAREASLHHLPGRQA